MTYDHTEWIRNASREDLQKFTHGLLMMMAYSPDGIGVPFAVLRLAVKFGAIKEEHREAAQFTIDLIKKLNDQLEAIAN